MTLVTVGVVEGGGVEEDEEAVTRTEVLADFELSANEVANTYRVLALSLDATVSSPLLLMLVPRVTDPLPPLFELTRHVTDVLGLFVPVTIAEN